MVGGRVGRGGCQEVVEDARRLWSGGGGWWRMVAGFRAARRERESRRSCPRLVRSRGGDVLVIV